MTKGETSPNEHPLSEATSIFLPHLVTPNQLGEKKKKKKREERERKASGKHSLLHLSTSQGKEETLLCVRMLPLIVIVVGLDLLDQMWKLGM